MSAPTPAVSVLRRSTAEMVGTALLLSAIVGSGIMADRLSAGSAGLALLVNSLATGAALVALILTFGPVSGAHFNPAVSVAEACAGRLSFGEAGVYAAVQVMGAIAGVGLAHLMFGEPLYAWSHHVRAGLPQMLSEAIATLGLLTVVQSGVRSRSPLAAFAVGAYITSAFWFTASTSFANPAVTLARALTDTFTGIRPADVPGFIVAQIAGTIAASLVMSFVAPVARVEDTPWTE